MYKRYLDDPSLPLPKSTKYDLKKRSASNVNCNDLNNVIPSQQAILNHPESSVCDITYTYSQETEAITHDDMGTLEISGSSLDGQLNSDGYVEAETFAEKEVDSEAWLGDNEPLVEDSNSECTEISLDLDSDSETSEIFSESEESEVSEENEVWYRPTNADATNQNLTHVTTVTIPYIKGTSETISRILQPYNIRVAHKPTTTLRHLLTNVKDRDEPNNRQGAVYKIKCSDCQASYIGETGRNLNTRLTEHKRATRNGDANNHIAVHHQLTNHNIDWDSAQCLTYSTNYFQRLTLESWYTNLEQTPLNRCQQLLAPYKRLIRDENKTDKRTSNRPT